MYRIVMTQSAFTEWRENLVIMCGKTHTLSLAHIAAYNFSPSSKNVLKFKQLKNLSVDFKECVFFMAQE